MPEKKIEMFAYISYRWKCLVSEAMTIVKSEKSYYQKDRDIGEIRRAIVELSIWARHLGGDLPLFGDLEEIGIDVRYW